jgi:hypothetical protein
MDLAVQNKIKINAGGREGVSRFIGLPLWTGWVGGEAICLLFFPLRGWRPDDLVNGLALHLHLPCMQRRKSKTEGAAYSLFVELPFYIKPAQPSKM